MCAAPETTTTPTTKPATTKITPAPPAPPAPTSPGFTFVGYGGCISENSQAPNSYATHSLSNAGTACPALCRSTSACVAYYVHARGVVQREWYTCTVYSSSFKSTGVTTGWTHKPGNGVDTITRAQGNPNFRCFRKNNGKHCLPRLRVCTLYVCLAACTKMSNNIVMGYSVCVACEPGMTPRRAIYCGPGATCTCTW